MDDLTRKQKYVITQIYKQYLLNSESEQIDNPNYFYDADSIKHLFGSRFSDDELDGILLSLLHKEYITGYKDEDSVSEFGVSDKTIIYMENKFKNGLKDILTFLSNFM
nr:MAG TPA: hypothetical protein [Caudoviricetes sp.]